MPTVPLSVIITTALTTLTSLLVTALYRKLDDYVQHSSRWRESTDKKLDTVSGALQTTMRATLIHNAEKYFERGWITPEEQASWVDMHVRYSELGANGLIESYRTKIDALEHRNV